MLTGVAGDGATVFAALTARGSSAPQAAGASGAAATTAAPGRTTAGTNAATTAGTNAATTAATTIEARRLAAGTAPTWRTELAGYGGPLVASGTLVIAALGGTRGVAGLTLRGDPGAAVVALDAATGAIAWTLAVDATDWSVIASLAATPDPGGGVIVGGTFSGTLRIADKVVSSAGQADGFVARIAAGGRVAWLVRVGGPFADAVHGVAAAGDRIVIAGTFAPGADLLGEPLPSIDERSARADGFVAELDAAGARRWVGSFGGPADDAVAGVAIDARGRVAVAATARDTVHVGGTELTAAGAADGLVAWWDDGGAALGAVLLGGADFDGLRAIVPAGDRVVVAGFYSGSLRLGSRTLTAGGGDDAFVAELDASGAVVHAWSVGGDGREEVTQLAAIPGGFVAGVAHTAAAKIDDAALPSPADPMAGAALAVRPVR